MRNVCQFFEKGTPNQYTAYQSFLMNGLELASLQNRVPCNTLLHCKKTMTLGMCFTTEVELWRVPKPRNENYFFIGDANAHIGREEYYDQIFHKPA